MPKILTIQVVSLPLVIRKNGPRPDTAKLKKELKKKRYPVKRISLIPKNPLEAGPSMRVFIVVYLRKGIDGPKLKRLVRDVYAWVYAKPKHQPQQTKRGPAQSRSPD